MSEELKECPFCGSGTDLSEGKVFVHCQNKACPLFVFGFPVEKWNTRYTPSPWIDVRERLPEHVGKIVFLCGPKERYPMVGYFTEHADGLMFFTADGYDLECDISHYMLPNPPKNPNPEKEE